MNRFSLSLGGLAERWTPVGAEQDLVAVKHRDTRLGFVLLLKFGEQWGSAGAGDGPGNSDHGERR